MIKKLRAKIIDISSIRHLISEINTSWFIWLPNLDYKLSKSKEPNAEKWNSSHLPSALVFENGHFVKCFILLYENWKKAVNLYKQCSNAVFACRNKLHKLLPHIKAKFILESNLTDKKAWRQNQWKFLIKKNLALPSHRWVD